jgi:hypothetical protein
MWRNSMEISSTTDNKSGYGTDGYTSEEDNSQSVFGTPVKQPTMNQPTTNLPFYRRDYFDRDKRPIVSIARKKNDEKDNDMQAVSTVINMNPRQNTDIQLQPANVLELFQRGKTVQEVVANSQSDINYVMSQLKETQIEDDIGIFSFTPQNLRCIRPTDNGIDLLNRIDPTSLLMACSMSIASKNPEYSGIKINSSDIDSLLNDFERRSVLSEITSNYDTITPQQPQNDSSEPMVTTIVITYTNEPLSKQIKSIQDALKSFINNNQLEIEEMNREILSYERSILTEEKETLEMILKDNEKILEIQKEFTTTLRQTYTLEPIQLIPYIPTENEDLHGIQSHTSTPANVWGNNEYEVDYIPPPTPLIPLTKKYIMPMLNIITMIQIRSLTSLTSLTHQPQRTDNCQPGHRSQK